MTELESYPQFVKALAIARRRCGITQKEAAKRLGVSRRQYIRYERGETVMTLDISIRLLSIYGLGIKLEATE